MDAALRKIYHQAMLSRDPRFDGRFYTGVKTTGIYCRPVCPARPKLQNIEFYRSKAEAENAGFRPCLRCRPDLSPLSPQWHGTAAVMPRAIRLLESGDANGVDLSTIADSLGMTDRHLRRLFREHVGASPIELAISRRLHLARQLLSQTQLPITEIAFAAGFNSPRRFNDAFLKTYHTSPRAFRKEASPDAPRESLRLSWPVVGDYDWATTFAFLKRHSTLGLEQAEDTSYARYFRSPNGTGHFRAWADKRTSVFHVELQLEQIADLRWTVEKIRGLFDLGHNPHYANLKRHKAFDLKGVRVPGAFDPFECAVSVVLSQLVTTEQGQRNMQKLVERFSEDTRFFPLPQRLAGSADAEWSGLGFTKARQTAIREMAKLFVRGDLDLSPASDLQATRRRLRSIPGVGAWTTELIALRCLKDPDAFPASDLIIKRATEKFGIDHKAYAPWRSYVTLALWRAQAKLLTRKKLP